MYKNADFSSTKNLHTLSFSLVPGQQNPASFYCVKLRKISSVTRQKGESQNGCFKKTKHAKFSEKQTFLTSWYAHAQVPLDTLRYRTCAYQVVIDVCFSGNLACFVFLKHPFWDSPFSLITTISALHFVISILMVFISLSIFMIKNATINPPDTNAVSKTNETAHFHENSDHVAGVAIFADGVLYEPFL